MLLIYTPHITNRIRYIMHYIFEERLGILYTLTNNKDEFKNNIQHLKIVYANEPLKNGLNFYACALLFEENIKAVNLSEGVFNDVKILFVHNKNSALPFDVFAAIFYLLSRYEEYLKQPLDIHGNYDYRNSILFKQKILNVPVVEQWIELLKEVLQKNFPSLQFKKHKSKFILS